MVRTWLIPGGGGSGLTAASRWSRRRRGSATSRRSPSPRSRTAGSSAASRKLATRFVFMALCWRFRRPEPRGAVQGSAMSRLATSRGRGEGPRRREDGFRDVPRGRKKCMVSRRDARLRCSAAWSRSRGPSEMERAVPGARRTSPGWRASEPSSRRRARSGPARPSGGRARRQGPAPARVRSSRRRPSMISSDFE